MHKIKRMLTRLRRLRRQYTREQVFENLQAYSTYSVMIIDHSRRSIQQKEFAELKEAVAYVYPDCKTEYNKEFFVYANTSKGKKFLQFKPVIL